MPSKSKIKYLGWSCFSIESEIGDLFFDPLFRPMAGVQWACLDDFNNAKIICLTHGHHEHYVDTPIIAKKTDAVVVAPKEICKHLRNRYGLKSDNLLSIEPYETLDVSGIKITAFEFRHRNISLLKAFIGGGIIHGLNFAYTNLFLVPFSARKFGYFIEMPDGLRIMNYGEGFNDKMQMEEVSEIGQHFKTDVLFTGVQLHFEKYVASGVVKLKPNSAILFHPHEKLFDKIGISSSSREIFANSIRKVMPDVEIINSEPNTYADIKSLKEGAIK